MTIAEAEEAIREFVLDDPQSLSAKLILEDILLRCAKEHGSDAVDELVAWLKLDRLYQ